MPDVVSLFRFEAIEMAKAPVAIAKPTGAPLATGGKAVDFTDPTKATVAPIITSLTWRVDVVISSSAVNRVMQPFVILKLGLSDGTFHTIELNNKAFHDLRYRTAEVLHSLHKLESNYLFALNV
jgi:hypothetical protein